LGTLISQGMNILFLTIWTDCFYKAQTFMIKIDKVSIFD